MESLSFSDARANLKAVMDRAVADRAPIAITRQKSEGMVMISASEWSSIEETLDLFGRPGMRSDCRGDPGIEARKGEEHELIEP